MKIRHLKNNEIDYKAYDFCIENSSQGTMYAMSWYLDVVSPQWELLMADDYNFVMPIPVKKKYFLKYAIQPYLCQQLGVFSLKELTSEIFISFIKKISYKYCHFFLNANNVFDGSMNFNLRSNYELDLSRSYDEIKAGFSTNCLRNIKKAEKEELEIENQTEENIYLDFLLANSENRPIKHPTNILQDIIESVTQHSKIEIWSVRNKNQNLLSCALFLKWKNRFYYFVPVSAKEGKLKQSMSYLLDGFIKHYAQSEFVLDFEGSSIANIARFYKGFGSQNKPYPELRKKNLLV